ncbi:MAG: hypothetical protein K2Y23_15315 [Cyanobacteria bacterium]|nr:hypothetical protein [Cyanobacteriota bacterium]
MPFLRLTRDRRGFENTFLMHADRPGDRPRLLYWYRTAPGIVQGRSPLDEDAIRTIEEQHPDIDFDWPAILALAEVMTPEDEAPAPRPQQQPRQGKRQRHRDQRPSQPQQSASAPQQSEELRPDDRVAESPDAVKPEDFESDESSAVVEIPPPRNLLVEELAGREIGSRLRARYAEIIARIQDLDVDGDVKDTWFKRAEAIDPETWMTPEQVLEGVRSADAQFDKLRSELM